MRNMEEHMNILGAGRNEQSGASEQRRAATERISGALHGWGDDVPEEYQLFPTEATSFTVEALVEEGTDPTIVSAACNEVSGRVIDSHPRVASHLATLATQTLVNIQSR